MVENRNEECYVLVYPSCSDLQNTPHKFKRSFAVLIVFWNLPNRSNFSYCINYAIVQQNRQNCSNHFDTGLSLTHGTTSDAKLKQDGPTILFCTHKHVLTLLRTFAVFVAAIRVASWWSSMTLKSWVHNSFIESTESWIDLFPAPFKKSCRAKQHDCRTRYWEDVKFASRSASISSWYWSS